MNPRMSVIALVIVIGALGVQGRRAIGDAQGPTLAKEADALRAADLAWSDSANRKDLDAVVSYMADDGETLAPNEPVARGKDAIRTSWKNLLALPGLTVRWEPAHVEVAKSGEMGYTSGTYTLSFTGADGKTVDDRGKYLEVWEKVNGTWKCAFDAYSSDLPAS